jgi:hypothetical protein
MDFPPSRRCAFLMVGNLRESGNYIAINGTPDVSAPLTPRPVLYQTNPCGMQMPQW